MNRKTTGFSHIQNVFLRFSETSWRLYSEHQRTLREKSKSILIQRGGMMPMPIKGWEWMCWLHLISPRLKLYWFNVERPGYTRYPLSHTGSFSLFYIFLDPNPLILSRHPNFAKKVYVVFTCTLLLVYCFTVLKSLKKLFNGCIPGHLARSYQDLYMRDFWYFMTMTFELRNGQAVEPKRDCSLQF